MLEKKKKFNDLDEIFEYYFDPAHKVKLEDYNLLADIVYYLRPKKINKDAIYSIQPLLQLLTYDDYCQQFRKYLDVLFKNKRCWKIITDSGIIKEHNFIAEIYKRIKGTILPQLHSKKSAGYILVQVFYKSTDYEWVRQIPMSELIALYDLLQLKSMHDNIKTNTLLPEMLYAMNILNQRISGRITETEILRMVPEYENSESPFIALERERMFIEQKVRNNPAHFITKEDLDYKQLKILEKQCSAYIERAYKNASRFGISLKVNQILAIIRQQLLRLRVLTSYLVIRRESDKKKNTILLMIRLLKYISYKDNIQDLIKESTQLVAYELTQLSAQTGEKYITRTFKEYVKMFWSSAGGGIIVGLLCIIKLGLSNQKWSDFGYAMGYSFNYAIGFILIYLTGCTLATKQPAMTANTIAKSLEEGMKDLRKTSQKYESFAKIFARLFRSQFIAFLGNILLAFPTTLIGIWSIEKIFHVNMAVSKYEKLFHDLHPYKSLLIVHAIIAGIFLFASGLITAHIANRHRFNQTYYRIEENPLLKQLLGNYKTRRLAFWLEQKWPAIVGNFCFGFFLGSTASIGNFLGLNLDIRHITFASGNFALGIYGSNFILSFSTLIWSLIGIILIGFLNFITSFSISIFLAIRSRGISFKEINLICIAILDLFKQNPWQFIYPQKL